MAFYLNSLSSVSLEPFSVCGNDALSSCINLVRIETEVDVLKWATISAADLSATCSRTA